MQEAHATAAREVYTEHLKVAASVCSGDKKAMMDMVEELTERWEKKRKPLELPQKPVRASLAETAGAAPSRQPNAGPARQSGTGAAIVVDDDDTDADDEAFTQRGLEYGVSNGQL
ncbi:hypothetical protein QJQ45_007747 [Haematococcus lacustris]|nr:hypothetical protein QJQ45_007747 [Haematococcus lacustris]